MHGCALKVLESSALKASVDTVAGIIECNYLLCRYKHSPCKV